MFQLLLNMRGLLSKKAASREYDEFVARCTWRILQQLANDSQGVSVVLQEMDAASYENDRVRQMVAQSGVSSRLYRGTLDENLGYSAPQLEILYLS